MSTIRANLVILFVVLCAYPASAETNLGISIKQGDNGHPVVVEVIQEVAGFKTLGAYLGLQPNDEIITAYSDPILLPDGKSYEKWTITSVSDLTWVLARTSSRIGLAVKRGDKIVKIVAEYTLLKKTIATKEGPREIVVGEWSLSEHK